MIKKTPLEAWIASKIGIGSGTLTREQVSGYQLRQLRETIQRAYHSSPFYRKRIKDAVGLPLADLDDLRRFPFTTAEDMRQQGLQFLCVSQDEIGRVVTLDSSGTTGRPKRIYFTAADQELTIDFFHQGMSTLVDPGDRVLILLPGERAGSVGDLLATALTRLGAHPIGHGVVHSLDATLGVMRREGVNSLVGIPIQILALARHDEYCAEKRLSLKSVLLSTDHVPRAVVRELGRLWGCEIFEHYGMTEMGLGGGVDCVAHAGYHMREGDLYFEIIDPATGTVLPEGDEGEVVVTTLTRQGMPLIRYRTGDISRFLPAPCPCGTALRRMAYVTGRLGSRVALRSGGSFTLADLDEALFNVDRICDFTATVDSRRGAARLAITATIAGQAAACADRALNEALETVAAIGVARSDNTLTATIEVVSEADFPAPKPVKRKISELSETHEVPDDLSHTARQNPAAR